MENTKRELQEILDAINGDGQYASKDGKPQPSAGNMMLIAQRLGCSRSAVYNYLKRWKAVANAVHEQRELTKDMVENQILKRIMAGSDTMMIFYAKTQMKDRGYVERIEHEDVSRWRIDTVEGLRNGEITPAAVREYFDKATALDLFREAGVKVTEDVAA